MIKNQLNDPILKTDFMAYRSKSHIPLLFVCVLKYKKETCTLILLIEWGNGNKWLQWS